MDFPLCIQGFTTEYYLCEAERGDFIVNRQAPTLQKMLCCVILLMFNLLQRLKICWGTIWGRNFAGQKKKRANIKSLLPHIGGYVFQRYEK
jgi:hypothetical protein